MPSCRLAAASRSLTPAGLTSPALVRFEEDGCHVSELSKCRMPGVGEPCTWEEFISFVADRIEPLMGRAESIGFCFSYSADITPGYGRPCHPHR